MLSDANEYLNKLIDMHEGSGLSYRKVSQQCDDLDPSYVHYILKAARCANRESKTARKGGIEWRG